MIRAIGIVLVLLVCAAVGYLILTPSPIDPVTWKAKADTGFVGDFVVNHRLKNVERLPLDFGFGAEDVAVDEMRRIYGGMADGRIIRMMQDGMGTEVFAATGGRPLGMHFDHDGNLIVCDADKGLLEIAPDGAITTLVTEYGGVPFAFTNDVDIAIDGTIYFTDASHRFSIHEYELDLMEQRKSGRFFAYNPKTKKTRLVADGLAFANGVALSADNSFALVNETGRHRVLKIWLAGFKAGEREVFVDNLPGYPDGISRGTDGVFWLAVVSPRLAWVDKHLGPSRFLRAQAAKLPRVLWPKPKAYGFVLGFDEEGKVVFNLQDPKGGYAQIASVQEHGNYLYLGSLVENAIGRISVPSE